MYRCPECGTEYTVVPDACTVCGHETDTSEHIDLFAKAAEQESRLAAQQKELRQQHQDRAKEHVYAQDSAKSRSAIAADDRLAVLEQAAATAPDGVREASGAGDSDATKGRSHTGLKIAAVSAAAAVALGGSAFWAYRSGKPAGFIRSTVGTFYLKDQDLWFQNGQTGHKICLKEGFLPLQSTRVLFTEYGNMPRLNEMLYVTPDGNDFYFPKIATIGVEDCALMHCTADHPELAEEVARINLRSGDYNDNVIYTSSYSYMPGLYGLYANSYMSVNVSYFQMNLPYVVVDGAVYYRNPDSEFCCTQNGETQVIAPFAERFWTLPDQTGVYYIGVPEYEDLREKREWLDGYIHTDDECMNGFAEVTFADGGETIQTRMHGSDYVLCRATPGNPAEQLVPERIEDWKPIRGDFTQYLYYTTFSPEDQITQLRRYDFLRGTAETVYSTDPDSKIVLLQDYPDGSCYFGAYKAPEPEDLEEWLPEPETRKLMSSESGAPKWYSLTVPMQNLTVFYQEAGGEPQVLPEFSSSAERSVYSAEMNTNARIPYICIPEYKNDSRKMHIYYRAQEVPVTFNQEPEADSAPDYMFTSTDGTRLFADVVEDNTADPDDADSELVYGVPKIKVFCGTLNGGAEVGMDLFADPDDDAAIMALELKDAPAEVLRVTYGDMYSGDEKIASGVLNTVTGWQPEYRQLCFVTNKDYKPSPDSAYIDMSKAYCGTLMRRADRKTETVAENVTDFVPFDKEQFMVICGEKGENGTLHYCAGEKQYQADTEVSNLIGLRTLAEKSFFERLFS